jgi:Tol biopolymer transport system component
MPDCQTLTFASSRSGVMNIYAQRADGGGEARRILAGPHTLAPGSWTPDGRLLAHVEIGGATGSDIWILDTATDRRQKFAGSKSNEGVPRISPDGRWLAYHSDESGRYEVYVRPLESQVRVQVSSDGGSSPAWSPDGRELFYVHERAVMRVRMPDAPGATPGDPEQVFAHPDLVAFRPTAHGFLFVRRTAEHLPLTKLNLVLNWFAELDGK